MGYKNKEDANANSKKWYEANKVRRASMSKEWHDANKEHHRELRTRWEMKRKQQISEYKLERGCATCGYRGHPQALHLHHLPGSSKIKSVSQMYKRSWDVVFAEMEKCRVLCANCHAIETDALRNAKIKIKKSAKDEEKERSDPQLKLRFA